MKTFAGAVDSVFSHSCSVLLIIFPLISISRRLYQQSLSEDCLNSTVS